MTKIVVRREREKLKENYIKLFVSHEYSELPRQKASVLYAKVIGIAALP